MSTRYQFAPDARSLARALEAIGWGLFLIWIGIALLSDFGWGVSLLGVGIITLGGQMARKYFNLRVELFWITVGVLFLLGGVWELFEIRLGLTPVLIIVAGILFLLSPLLGRKKA